MSSNITINSILEIIPDGRFVVVYNTNKIATLNGSVPDLSGMDTPEKLFLAGVAYARLGGLDGMTNPIEIVESEEI